MLIFQHAMVQVRGKIFLENEKPVLEALALAEHRELSQFNRT